MQNKNVKHLETIKGIIGAERFQTIVAELPGAAIKIPSDPEYFNKRERNEKLMEDFHVHKMSVSDLAEKYNLSRSTIYRITEKR